MAVFDTFNPLQNVTPRFTEPQLAEIIQFFDEHAKPLLTINDGEPIDEYRPKNADPRASAALSRLQSCSVAYFHYIFVEFHRRHFNYPTYKEIMDEAEQMKVGVTRVLTKDQFIYILDKWVIEAKIRHELLLAFQVFDTEKRDFLELGELESIVTGYGDAFNNEETKEILRDANVRGDGNIVYENFVESLFDMAPELYDIKADFLYTDPDEDPSVPPLPPEPEPEPEPEPVAPPPPPPPPPPPAKKGKKKK